MADYHPPLPREKRARGCTDAEERFREAIELDPKYPKAHNNLGRLLATVRGNYPGAERHARRSGSTRSTRWPTQPRQPVRGPRRRGARREALPRGDRTRRGRGAVPATPDGDESENGRGRRRVAAQRGGAARDVRRGRGEPATRKVERQERAQEGGAASEEAGAKQAVNNAGARERTRRRRTSTGTYERRECRRRGPRRGREVRAAPRLRGKKNVMRYGHRARVPTNVSVGAADASSPPARFNPLSHPPPYSPRGFDSPLLPLPARPRSTARARTLTSPAGTRR